MLFNSIGFALFLLGVFTLHWLLPRRATCQNALLLGASLFFYAYWDWRLLGLFAGSVIFTYLVGLGVQSSDRPQAKFLMGCGIGGLLGALCVFKYYNFFVGSINALAGQNFSMLKLILPLGISFYTFMAIGYLVDVYQGKIVAERNLLTFSTFLCFFPQIAAGPIGRAPQMIPQFRTARKFDFDQGSHGLCLIAYGLFKKMVVADLISLYLSLVWEQPGFYGSLTCLIGAVFYAVQIYCDFSGYSDMARGVAKLMGVELMLNFNRPYLSDTFGSFWRNWHISLSTWFRDYVYIPLGGSRCALPRVILNTWIVFLLSGLWHGAAWTFVLWGGLHAVFLTGGILNKRFIHLPKSRILVFLGVTFAWIFFRAGTWERAVAYVKALATCEFKTNLSLICGGQGPMTLLFCLLACGLLSGSYLLPRDCAFTKTWHKVLFVVGCMAAVVFMGVPAGGEFIYFQF